MRTIAEDPYEDPDEEPEPEPTSARTPTAHMPTVADRGRDWEYRVDVISIPEVVDGGLATRLTEASAAGWDFIQIVDAGDRRAVVFRKPKTAARTDRTVGFVLPIRA